MKKYMSVSMERDYEKRSYKWVSRNAQKVKSFDDVLNEHAKQGWKLHSGHHLAGSEGGSVGLILVFELET